MENAEFSTITEESLPLLRRVLESEGNLEGREFKKISDSALIQSLSPYEALARAFPLDDTLSLLARRVIALQSSLKDCKSNNARYNCKNDIQNVCGRIHDLVRQYTILLAIPKERLPLFHRFLPEDRNLARFTDEELMHILSRYEEIWKAFPQEAFGVLGDRVVKYRAQANQLSSKTNFTVSTLYDLMFEEIWPKEEEMPKRFRVFKDISGRLPSTLVLGLSGPAKELYIEFLKSKQPEIVIGRAEMVTVQTLMEWTLQVVCEEGDDDFRMHLESYELARTGTDSNLLRTNHPTFTHVYLLALCLKRLPTDYVVERIWRADSSIADALLFHIFTEHLRSTSIISWTYDIAKRLVHPLKSITDQCDRHIKQLNSLNEMSVQKEKLTAAWMQSCEDMNREIVKFHSSITHLQIIGKQFLLASELDSAFPGDISRGEILHDADETVRKYYYQKVPRFASDEHKLRTAAMAIDEELVGAQIELNRLHCQESDLKADFQKKFDELLKQESAADQVFRKWSAARFKAAGDITRTLSARCCNVFETRLDELFPKEELLRLTEDPGAESSLQTSFFMRAFLQSTCDPFGREFAFADEYTNVLKERLNWVTALTALAWALETRHFMTLKTARDYLWHSSELLVALAPKASHRVAAVLRDLDRNILDDKKKSKRTLLRMVMAKAVESDFDTPHHQYGRPSQALFMICSEAYARILIPEEFTQLVLREVRQIRDTECIDLTLTTLCKGQDDILLPALIRAIPTIRRSLINSKDVRTQLAKWIRDHVERVYPYQENLIQHFQNYIQLIDCIEAADQEHVQGYLSELMSIAPKEVVVSLLQNPVVQESPAKSLWTKTIIESHI